MKGKNNHLYLALDSDILRALALYAELIEQGLKFDPEHSLEATLKKHYEYIGYIFNAIINDTIRFFVTDTIYQENKHSQRVCNFIKTYLYVPDYNLFNYSEKSLRVGDLAAAYCSPYIYNGETLPAPMKVQYSAATKNYVPSNDCYAMAEAAIEHCSFVTNNGQDFVFVKVDDGNKDRMKGIARINIQYGYCGEGADGNVAVPRPISLSLLGMLLKKKLPIETIVPEDVDFVKAKDFFA